MERKIQLLSPNEEWIIKEFSDINQKCAFIGHFVDLNAEKYNGHEVYIVLKSLYEIFQQELNSGIKIREKLFVTQKMSLENDQDLSKFLIDCSNLFGEEFKELNDIISYFKLLPSHQQDKEARYEIEFANLNSKIDRLKKITKSQQSTISDMNQKIAVLSKENEKINEFELMNDELRIRIKQLEGDLQQSRINKEFNRQKESNKMRDMDQIQKELEDERKRSKSLLTDKERMSKEMEMVMERISTLRQEIMSVQSNYDAMCSKLHQSIHEKDEKIWKLEKRLDNVNTSSPSKNDESYYSTMNTTELQTSIFNNDQGTSLRQIMIVILACKRLLDYSQKQSSILREIDMLKQEIENARKEIVKI